jgi:hypothetical protein
VILLTGANQCIVATTAFQKLFKRHEPGANSTINTFSITIVKKIADKMSKIDVSVFLHTKVMQTLLCTKFLLHFFAENGQNRQK